MNDEQVKVAEIAKFDDIATKLNEVEEVKEIWKSILNDNNIEYKFEIKEFDERFNKYFKRSYILELWVRSIYYQTAKETIEELENAPSENDAWELQNEISIEDEELYETVNTFQDNKDNETTYENKNIVLKIYTLMVIVLILSILAGKAIREKNQDLAMIVPLIVFGLIISAIIIMTIIMIRKRRK